MSFFLQKTMIMLVGRGRWRGFPAVAGRAGRDRRRPPLQLQIVIIVVSLVLLASTTWFLKATRLGLEMRAAPRISAWLSVLGIKANCAIATAFAISAVLAGAVACLFVCRPACAPRMGLQLVIIAFVGTVIGGGLASPGAALRRLPVGAAPSSCKLLPLDLRVFREAFVFAAVRWCALVPPQGLIPGARPQGAHERDVGVRLSRNVAGPAGCLDAAVVPARLPCRRAAQVAGAAEFAPTVVQRRITQVSSTWSRW